MKLWKNNVPLSCQSSTSVVKREETRQPIYRRPSSLTTRVRIIDCMLADIQAQVQRLYRERTHVGLVREELAGTEARGEELHRARPRCGSRRSSESGVVTIL